MNFWVAVKVFLIVGVISAYLGYYIRCAQEKLLPSIRVAALLLFPFYIVFTLVVPFFVAYKQLQGDGELQKFNRFVRAILAVVSIPMSYVIIIGNYGDLADDTIWKMLGELNRKQKFKVRQAVKQKQKSPVPRVKVSTGFGTVFASMAAATEKLGDRVQHSGFMTKYGA